MSVAIEDAGFITHPLWGWIFFSGFPKAHNAARAIDRALGKEGTITPVGDPVRRIRPGADQEADGTWEKLQDRFYQPGMYQPATPEAAQWNGWAYSAQALKPALEPIYMGQKPFSEDNGALNILRWGVGALNIDGCRVPMPESDRDLINGTIYRNSPASVAMGQFASEGHDKGMVAHDLGRWPANVVHDNSPETVATFPESDGQQGDALGTEGPNDGYGGYGRVPFAARGRRPGGFAGTGADKGDPFPNGPTYADAGSAARFFNACPFDDVERALFYPKAASNDRLGSKHATIKPLALIQHMVRMICPKGGTVLDCFAGTGTTGEAAWREGMNAILIEREEEYQADIARRMELAVQPTKREAVAKSKNNLERPEDLPLFAGMNGGDR